MTGDAFFIKDGFYIGIIIYSVAGYEIRKFGCPKYNDQDDPENFGEQGPFHAQSVYRFKDKGFLGGKNFATEHTEYHRKKSVFSVYSVAKTINKPSFRQDK